MPTARALRDFSGAQPPGIPEKVRVLLKSLVTFAHGQRNLLGWLLRF